MAKIVKKEKIKSVDNPALLKIKLKSAKEAAASPMIASFCTTALWTNSDFRNPSKSDSARNAVMWSAASMMSCRYRSSRRIDEPRVCEHGRPDARFQSVLRYQVDFPPQKLRKLQH